MKEQTGLIPGEVLFSEPLKYNPQISPDGKKIAYIAPVNNILNLWIKTIGEEDDRLLTCFEKRGLNVITGGHKKAARYYMWVTDRYIVYFYDTDGNKNYKVYRIDLETMEIKNLTRKYVYARFVTYNKKFPYEMIILMNNREFCDFYHYDLYHIDIKTEKITLRASNPGNIIYWITDSSLQILAIVSGTDDGGEELSVRENEKSDWRKLFTFDREGLLQNCIIGYSKDNNYIYMVDSSNVNTCHVVRIEIATEKCEVIAHDPEHDIWDSEEFLYDPGTGEIQAVCYNKYRKEWILLDETIKEDFEAIRKIDTGDFSIVSRDDTDETWIIAFDRDNGPVAYYTYSRTLKKEEFLFYNQPSLKNYTLAHMKEITFTSRDGLTIHGYMTCPPGENKNNLPLVLYVHGGPWCRDTWGYNPTVQWFASRGYICLQINYRGSSGYGKNFLNAGNREWGGKMQDDLLDGIDWAIKKGIAEPGKIAIYGAGYGGYAALAGATFTPDLFCCAIAIGCPGDLVSFIQSVPAHWKAQRKELIKRIGDPEMEKEFLISRSPFYHVDRIKIPVFISYSLNEQMVASKTSYRIVRAIQSRGVEVEYLVFPDEGYHISKGKNRIKLHRFAEKFLARHMGGSCENGTLYLRNKNINISNEREIIDKILKEGDKHAFELLVEQYKKPLLTHLINMTGNVGLSLELLQETFVRVWIYLETYSFNRAFFPWICKIATNVVIKHRRIESNSVSKKISLDEIDVDNLIILDENIDDKAFIQSMINSLKEPYKTAMFLRFIEDMDYKNIAAMMHVTTNQVKKYLFRAKKLLERSWEKNNFQKN